MEKGAAYTVVVSYLMDHRAIVSRYSESGHGIYDPFGREWEH